MTRILDKARAAPRLRSAGHGKLGLHPADPRFLLPPALRQPIGAHCGVVIQSALRRSEADIDDLIAMKARVRLCKGAYLEPPTVAFPDKKDVDRNYVRLMERLLLEGNYPGIATHDETIIEHARQFARREQIASGPLRVPDALRRPAGSPDPPPAGRVQHAGLYPLRDPMVSLSHAAAGGAARQYRLHSGKPRTRVGAGPVSEFTLGGYMREARARRRLRRQRRPGLLGGHLRGRGARCPGLYGAALLFVRWSPGGDRPVGHVESETLAWGKTPEEAESRLESRSRSTMSRPRWTKPSPSAPGSLVTRSCSAPSLERDGAVYRVATADGEVRAVLRGKAKRETPRVVVGDRVRLEPEPDRRGLRRSSASSPAPPCWSGGSPRAAAPGRSPPTSTKSSWSPPPPTPPPFPSSSTGSSSWPKPIRFRPPWW